tara:strand:- start:786 stop:977 length:192 start_codon:yes stop_codon:yes gene_type:complete
MKTKIPNPFRRPQKYWNPKGKGYCQFHPAQDNNGFNVILGIRFTSMDQIRNMILDANPHLEGK